MHQRKTEHVALARPTKISKKHVEQMEGRSESVFNDETTLTAPMGDWLHMHNHQESEWWLSVRGKCIYRQRCGEWSQFSQLNLGRLR
jgi:hypothetical protein